MNRVGHKRLAQLTALALVLLAGCASPTPTAAPAAMNTPEPAVTATPSPTRTPVATAIGGGSGLYVTEDSTSASVADSAGNNPIPVGPVLSETSRAAWSRDGGRLAYSTFGDKVYKLVVASSDGSNEVEYTLPAGAFHLAWSPDGKTIVFDMQYDIYLIDASSGQLTNLTNSSRTDQSPSWSPDGTQIAYTSFVTGEFRIFVMNADGSDKTTLTRPDRWELDPAWSPDGEVIAYVGGSTDNWYVKQIELMSPDGSHKRSLMGDKTLSDAGDLRWSPDGTILIFDCSPLFRHHTCVVNRDGSGYRQFGSGPSMAYFSSALQPLPPTGPAPTVPPIQTALPSPTPTQIVLSPAGSAGWIAFTSRVHSTDQIFVINPDGTGLVQITESDDDNRYPSWSPDGSKKLSEKG